MPGPVLGKLTAMAIQFDEKNLLAGMVGKADGLSRSEIDRSQSKALKALKSFRKKSEARLYGFPHLPFQTPVIQAIGEYAGEVGGTYDTVCLVGIGGSALGAWALDCGIRGPHPVQGAFTPRHPRLVILDNVDPSFTSSALGSMDPRKTLVVVIAKSGGTAETVSTFLIVHDWLTGAGPQSQEPHRGRHNRWQGRPVRIGAGRRLPHLRHPRKCRRPLQRALALRAAPRRAHRHRHPQAHARG